MISLILCFMNNWSFTYVHSIFAFRYFLMYILLLHVLCYTYFAAYNIETIWLESHLFFP